MIIETDLVKAEIVTHGIDVTLYNKTEINNVHRYVKIHLSYDMAKQLNNVLSMILKWG